MSVSAIPTTIPAGAGATSPPTSEDLYMLYVQASYDGIRYQWIVFPPAVSALGLGAVHDRNPGRKHLILSRKQDFPGNRSKWMTGYLYKNSDFLDLVSERVRRGFDVEGISVVPLEIDDYLMVHRGTTPQKAIRAVDRVISGTHGLSVK